MQDSVEASVSRSVVPDSLRSRGLQPTRLLYLWDFPGKDTGVVCHFLFQGIFLTQDRTQVSCTAGRLFTDWATRGASWIKSILEYFLITGIFLTGIVSLVTKSGFFLMENEEDYYIEDKRHQHYLSFLGNLSDIAAQHMQYMSQAYYLELFASGRNVKLSSVETVKTRSEL